jgi:hypothetical protein
MRSISSTAKGRRPWAAYDATNSTSAAHGTTRALCARNSRLRVRLVVRFKLRWVCCMTQAASTLRAALCRPSLAVGILSEAGATLVRLFGGPFHVEEPQVHSFG